MGPLRLDPSQSIIRLLYTFFTESGELGMSFALKSPVSLISDDLLGEMIALAYLQRV